MSRRSIQLRAVLAAAAAIVLVLVAVGAAVDLLVARHLHASLDRTLRQRAVEVSQLSASAPAVLTRPGALDSPVGGAQLSVEVIDRRGRIVARSLALGGQVLPLGGLVGSAIAHGASGYRDARLGTDPVRVYVAPLAEFGGKAAGGAVIVAASTRDLGETVASLRLISVLAALVAAILAAGPVALLMRRALRPIGQLADAASEIERTGDPRRRLPEYPAADEVGRLGKTLNAMLASLEHSRDAERRFLADASHELRTPLTAKAQLVPASTGRRRDASASAPSKKAIIQTSLCPPPAKSRASIGFQPTKAAANAGIGAATTAKPTTTSIPTAASNRYVKAVVSAERPVAVARPAEAAEKTGP